jgi:hypothetical protein
LHFSNRWIIVAFMEQLPIKEADDQKVFRIARALGISLEDAAVTCAGFELAFSDDGMRRAIFEIIDELDRSAAKKGEPLGLIINYTVELGMDGIRVGRYADEIPVGEIVELTPTDRANIFLRINDKFPTEEFLGPLIVNRPGWHFDTFDPDAEIAQDLSHLQPARQPKERFPFLSTAGVPSQLAGSSSFFSPTRNKALEPLLHLQPLAASQAGIQCVPLNLRPLPASDHWRPRTLRSERCPPAPGN